jgi:hypothetical protein
LIDVIDMDTEHIHGNYIIVCMVHMSVMREFKKLLQTWLQLGKTRCAYHKKERDKKWDIVRKRIKG